MTSDPESGQSQSPITRRRFVAGSLVAGAAEALPGAADAKAKPHPKHRAAKPTHEPSTETTPAGSPISQTPLAPRRH
jgi:hypothetical protein